MPTTAPSPGAAVVPDPAIERYGSPRKSASMHVVKSGETLGGIAKKYHTTTAALMKANRLRKPLIFPGQSLVVRRRSLNEAVPPIAAHHEPVVAVAGFTPARKSRHTASSPRLYASSARCTLPSY